MIFPPSPPPKTDDVPLHTNTQPSEPVVAFGSPHSEDMLDDLLNRVPARPASKPANPPQGNNAANNAALAGAGSGGRGVGGASTPNAGGGGGGASGGGGAGGGANWNQLLSNHVNMVGSALSSGGTPTVATPTTTAPIPAANAPTPAIGGASLSQTTHAEPFVYKMTAPTLGHSLAAPASRQSQQDAGSDPLYVLDMNTGETIPANVTLNSFANWSENLLAQVSGVATTINYTWDTSQAPDLINISGQNSANLQGTWASFAGPPIRTSSPSPRRP
jgi:hypothetical protein